MESKRWLLFFTFTVTFLLVWQQFVVPKFLPKPPPAAQQAGAAPKAAGPDGLAKNPADAAAPAAGANAAPGQVGVPNILPALDYASGPSKVVTIGSSDFQSPYRLLVTLNSRGAAVDQIELNDPRYRELHDDNSAIKVVSVGFNRERTFQTKFDLPAVLDDKDWNLVQSDASSATFRLAPKGPGLEFTKRFWLEPLAGVPTEPGQAAPAYRLAMELSIRNAGQAAVKTEYQLLGPVAVPLENAANTTKFRDVAAGFVNGDYVRMELYPASNVANGKTEVWTSPLAWIGIDVQYFAALIYPPVPAKGEPSVVRSATQQLLGPKMAEKSDVTVLLSSQELLLQPGETVQHRYDLYAGPKDEHVLPPSAQDVVNHGRLAWISKPMLNLLKLFYSVVGSYGIAIICLTVVVRACLLPLSLRQARMGVRMQEAQKKLGPDIEAVRKKFASDPQKMNTEIWAVYQKHGVNPLTQMAGCAPVLIIQLPIFMALYSALNLSIDLRRAPFLWITNLAAPDALFQLPFRVPLLGWTEFNLLPFITIALFMLQQKMFMPPPANEEQRMQFQMMNIMTVAMGFMFYRVPAGLCVYFIASSLWGIVERKMLPKSTPAPLGSSPGGTVIETTATPVNSDSRSRPSSKEKDSKDAEPGKETLLSKLLKAADKDQSFRRDKPNKKSRDRR